MQVRSISWGQTEYYWLIDQRVAHCHSFTVRIWSLGSYFAQVRKWSLCWNNRRNQPEQILYWQLSIFNASEHMHSVCVPPGLILHTEHGWIAVSHVNGMHAQRACGSRIFMGICDRKLASSVCEAHDCSSEGSGDNSAQAEQGGTAFKGPPRSRFIPGSSSPVRRRAPASWTDTASAGSLGGPFPHTSFPWANRFQFLSLALKWCSYKESRKACWMAALQDRDWVVTGRATLQFFLWNSLRSANADPGGAFADCGSKN